MQWICTDCAAKRGSFISGGHIATWHVGKCDVCHEQKPVTEPRDFRPRPDAARHIFGLKGGEL